MDPPGSAHRDERTQCDGNGACPSSYVWTDRRWWRSAGRTRTLHGRPHDITMASASSPFGPSPDTKDHMELRNGGACHCRKAVSTPCKAPCCTSSVEHSVHGTRSSTTPLRTYAPFVHHDVHHREGILHPPRVVARTIVHVDDRSTMRFHKCDVHQIAHAIHIHDLGIQIPMARR